MYTDSLAPMGFDTLGATGCAEAIRIASVRLPRVVITELVLSDGDGWQLLRHFRQTEVRQNTRVIALTGYVSPRILERARHARYDRFLVKPYDPQALAHVLVGLLS
jgi:CheY-like chemotaxis protein